MIECLTRDSICEITLNRPEKRNALTPEMLAELASHAEALARSEAHAAVVAAEGPAFCAGFDLSYCRGPEGPRVMRAFLADLSRTIVAFRAAPMPIVMTVQGPALAGGCALLGGADVVVASRNATFGYPVVRLGVSPAVSAPFLRQSVGDGPCRARLLDPGPIDAERAHDLGLVHELCEDAAQAEAKADAIARALWAKPRGGIAATKRWLNEFTDPGDTAAAALDVSTSLTDGDETRAMLEAFFQ
ncbi:MAG: enoyl-CoA hydratase/isomerase family protein, partial [Planctomycetota bacterium]